MNSLQDHKRCLRREECNNNSSSNRWVNRVNNKAIMDGQLSLHLNIRMEVILLEVRVSQGQDNSSPLFQWLINRSSNLKCLLDPRVQHLKGVLLGKELRQVHLVTPSRDSSPLLLNRDFQPVNTVNILRANSIMDMDILIIHSILILINPVLMDRCQIQANNKRPLNSPRVQLVNNSNILLQLLPVILLMPELILELLMRVNLVTLHKISPVIIIVLQVIQHLGARVLPVGLTVEELPQLDLLAIPLVMVDSNIPHNKVRAIHSLKEDITIPLGGPPSKDLQALEHSNPQPNKLDNNLINPISNSTRYFR